MNSEMNTPESRRGSRDSECSFGAQSNLKFLARETKASNPVRLGCRVPTSALSRARRGADSADADDDKI